MSRQDRRKAAKLSRHATNDEIFPGEHGPIQQSARVMLTIMEAIKEQLPDFEVTIFLAEKPKPGGPPPRFNYASTAAREDMYAVLRAFLAKNAAVAGKLDKIDDAPPTERTQ